MTMDAKKRELLDAVLRQRGVDPASLPIPPRPDRHAGIAPLSFAQERLWVVERLEPGRPTYNEAYAIDFTGDLAAEALAAALLETGRRHEILRTTFTFRDGRPLQVIAAAPDLPLPLVDLAGVPAAEREAAAGRRVQEAAGLPFDLERGPLVRALLLRLAPAEHRLVLVLHHILCDATSIEILVGELVALHNAFRRGVQEGSPLAAPRLQYADFAVWQRERRAAAIEQRLAAWKERLAGAPTVLELPADRPRTEAARGRGASLAAALPAALSGAVKALAQAEQATLFMTLLAAFEVLVSKLTGRLDFLLGSPIAGRTRSEVQEMPGFFVNTLVVRADLAGDPTFREVLARNRHTVAAAYDHQDVPFGRLVEELRPERAASHAPLVQVLFLLQKAGARIETGEGLDFSMRRLATGTAKFELTFLTRDAGDEIACGVEYDSDLFRPETMERLLRRYRVLLETVAADPGVRLSDLELLAPEERAEVLAAWQGPVVRRPEGVCVHELIAAQALRTPDAPAVIAEERSLTYRELMAAARRLARHLRALGVGTDDLVGLCLEPSPDLLVAVLGILEAGGAYMPLDPGQPADRLAWIVADTGLRVVLTESALAGRLPATAAAVLVDRERAALAGLPDGPLARRAIPGSLAYQIYTSGSTGRPKGVMVSHGGLVNLALSFAESFHLGPGGRMLLLLSVTFDASVGDLFPPLVAGAALVVHRTPHSLLGRNLETFLARQRITCLELSTAFWQQWTEDLAARRQAPPEPLRTLIAGGEAVTLDKVRTWFRLLAGRPFRFRNHYGPTEGTVCATAFEVTGAVALAHARLPIGRPLPNVRIHLLGPDLRLVPPGAAGEIAIGGAGVARGYLGNPDVTADRFIPDPFGAPGDRLYRTGDLARWLPDGDLDFLGRVDHQVKIRGFRVEPGEIEAALAAHPGVREVAVLARADAPGPRRLAAYVVPGDPAPDAAGLRAFLKAKLPAHMVPEAFVFLERFPLSTSGKVDRKALPAPVFERGEGEPFAAPEGATEQAIAAVWRELLGIERVGLHDNFFDLGGHSLLLIRMEGMLRDALARPVEVVDLFRHPTIAALADHLDGAADAAPEAGPVTARELAEPGGHDIAIVGMTGRFPGARHVDQLWRNLRDGVESIRFFSAAEMRAAGVPEEMLADPFYVRAKGVLDEVEGFDAKFFGFSPREAEILDPQHRHFLECSWEALESAGYDPERPPGPIGVFASVGRNSYFTSNLLNNPAPLRKAGVVQSVLGNDRDFLPTRVSYKLNLQGPSLVVQTACSSSLVAVHLACRSLLEGECDMALAGGVTIPVPQVSGFLHEDGGIFSNDGHCRAFDAKAKGTVPGSGVAVVVLRRLRDALADGDFIHAVIKSSAINNDGNRKIGYTAPSPEGQIRVIREAIARAGVDAGTITYVETHGTGTLLGDLVEVTALKEAYRPLTQRVGSCALGSLKTNVGHMDTAAGVGGLIKATLALRNRQIPPSLHFREANPKLDMGGSPFFVNAELREWNAEDGPRRAAVSSFGIGGTNAHLILEEAPAQRPVAPARAEQLLVVSARTAPAAARAADRLADHLESHPEIDLADVAATLQSGRRAFEHRAAALCRSREEALAALRGEGGLATAAFEGPAPQVVFLFPGSGTQRPGMGADLYRDEPVFRAAVDRTAELFMPLLGSDLRDLLLAAPDAAVAARLQGASLNTAALFTVSHALAELWISWGIRPQAMIGHSLGEYVAACLAGVLPLASAVALVAERGRLFDTVLPGAMLSVPLGEMELLKRLRGDVAVAAVNGPHFCVASGPVDAIAELERSLAAEGLDCRRIPLALAGHSPMLDPILADFRRFVETLALQPPKIPYVSTATGAWITAAEVTDPGYWVRHLRQTVRFADGMATLRKESGRIFLEVGPGKTLVSLLRDQEGAAGSTVLASLQDRESLGSARAALLRTLGSLWLHGVAPDWQAVRGESRRRIPLPTYPFERQRFWIDALPTAAAAADPWQRRPDPGDWLWVPSWRRVPAGRRSAAGPRGRWLVLGEAASPAGGLAARLAAAGEVVETSAAMAVAGAGGEVVWWPEESGAVDAVDAGAALLVLAESLEALPRDARPGLTVVLPEALEVVGGEALRPERAALAGAVRGLADRGVRARVLDPGPGSGVETVAAELLAGPEIADTAFRGAHRWLRCDEPLHVAADPGAGPLRPGDTVLLTGAAGAVRRLLEEALGAAGVRVLPGDAEPGRADALLWIAPEPPAAEPGESFVARELARLGELDRLGGDHGAGIALAVFPLLAEAGDRPSLRAAAQRELAAAWIQGAGPDRRLPWRGAVLENLPPSPGAAWASPPAGELAEALRRLATLAPGAWATLSTGDLPGRLAAWRSAATGETAGPEAPAAVRSALHPRPPLDVPYVAPRNQVERDLAALWQDLLGIERVGVHDSYFDLGGDSVTSIQIVTRANKAGYKLTQRKAFHHPTIAELARAAVLDTRIHAQQSAIEGPVHLIPIQRWFFEQELATPHHWNFSQLLRAEPPLHPVPLEAAVRTVLEHHDALRLRYSRGDAGWRQTSPAPGVGPGSFACVDLSALPPDLQGAALEAAAAGVQASLDLSAGPLARFVLFRRAGDIGDIGDIGDRLLAVIHHLVVDAPSWSLVLEDLEAAYDQAARGQVPELPAKTTSFKHWGITLYEHARSGALAPETGLWLDARRQQVAPLPVDLPGGRNEAGSARTLTFTLPAEETQTLLQETTRALQADLQEILLTALAQSLAWWTGRRRFLIDLEGLGREPLRDEVDLSRTVGWFTSSYPLLLDLEEEADPGAELERVREAVRAVPGRGLGYGLLRYMAGQDEVAARLSALPQPELAFVYLGQTVENAAAEGRLREAPEAAGPARARHDLRGRLLSLAVRAAREGLQLSLSYSESLHRRATLEGLAQTFFDKLRRLSASCRPAAADIATSIFLEESWSHRPKRRAGEHSS